MPNLIKTMVSTIKDTHPLILNVTNVVTMDFIANGLLSLGASPIMTKAPEEIEDLLKITHVLVVNMGTLNEEFIHLAHQGSRRANLLKKPIILDPVGAGASQYRTQHCLDLLENFQYAIIRGNASEIMALAGAGQNTKGVDSMASTADAAQSAQYLSSRYQCVVVVSGETDLVVQGNQIQSFTYGSHLMPRITGSGCLLSAVVGAFHAVHENAFEAASAAVVFYGKCGEMAAKNSTAPGTFKVHFLDALFCCPEYTHNTYHHESI